MNEFTRRLLDRTLGLRPEPERPNSSSVSEMYMKNMASADLLRELERRGIVQVEAHGTGLCWTFPRGSHWDPIPAGALRGLSLTETTALRRLESGWRPAAIGFKLRKRLQECGYIDSCWRVTPLGKQVIARG